MRGFRLLILAFLLSSLLLQACSTANSPSTAWPAGVPARNAAIANEKITLRVWFAADYVNTPPIRALIADFERAYPNITVETRSDIIWEDMSKQVELAISQGDPPDIAHGHAFAMGAQGLAEPLDDLWQMWNAESEFMPGAMEDVSWKGRYYGVPLDINCLFTIYNKRLLREARLPKPSKQWTFDDLEVMAPLLTKPDGSQYAVALDSSGWRMAGFVAAAGGELLTERDGKIVATLNDPRVIDALKLQRWMAYDKQVGTLPPPIVRQSDHPVTLFREGKVAMIFSGPWDLARLRQEAPEMMADVGTASLPRGTGANAGGSVLGGGSLYVPRGAKHREAAFEFMKWAVSEPYAMRLAVEQGRYPVKTRFYDNPELQTDPLLKPFYEQLKYARPYKLEAYRSANDTWTEISKAAFDPTQNLDEVIRAAQQRIQQQIDDVEAAASQEPITSSTQ